MSIFIPIIASTLLPISLKEEKRTPPVTELRIDQEIYCTDKIGVANPYAIINLRVGQNIKIYLPTGEYFSGHVTFEEFQEKQEVVKIVGQLNSHKNAGFGFLLSKKDGAFKGSIVFMDEKKIYDLEYNLILKGFVFQLRKD
jgi:hypothetical protein